MTTSVSSEDIQKIQAIIRAFYGPTVAAGFTESSVTEETVRVIAQLLVETTDCSRWVDAVPSPQDLLKPSKTITRWAFRLIRKAGTPFIQHEVKISWLCRKTRAAQFRTDIEITLR